MCSFTERLRVQKTSKRLQNFSNVFILSKPIESETAYEQFLKNQNC